MLDLLQGCFKQQFQLSHMAALMNHLANVITIVQAEYTKDKDYKNAAIDAICQILQGLKESSSTNNSSQNQKV
jgi:hypothetical protein